MAVINGSEPASTMPANRMPARRLAGIELLRIAGAFGIVLFHLGGPGANIGYTALPMFIFLSVFFALTTRKAMSLADFTGERLKRLMVPWIFWSGVIAVLKMADALHDNRPVSSEFALWNLLAGPAIHLWFLPYVAILSICLRILMPAMNAAGLIPVLIAGLSIAAWALFALHEADMGYPFQQWVFGLPAVMMAMCFAQGGKGAHLRVALVWGLFCMVMGFYFLQPGAVQLAVTLFAFFAAIWLPLPLTPGLRFLSGLSLGIYILHPLVATSLQRAGFPAYEGSMYAVVTIFACTAIVTAVLRGLPITRRML